MDDDRLPALLSALPPSSNYFSLEFFPPKTSSGFSNLQARLVRMTAALRPLFVTVTWGAGGSTATKSLELAEVCQRQLGVPTVLHLTCTNMSRTAVDDALEGAKEVGIRNILALRGDPPREEYRDTDENGSGGSGTDSNVDFTWAVDLVRHIRRKYGDYFSIGVAGYPEGHADESNPEAGKQNVEHDLPYLEEKVAAGANFIMTQLTYDVNAYRSYEKRLRGYIAKDGRKLFENIPIIPGLMPIQSYQIIKRITKLSHATIPEDISKRIEAVKSDDEAVKKVGVDVLSEIVEQIKDSPQPKAVPRGFHFYTLNLEKSVAFILERTELIPTMSEPSPGESSDSDAIADDEKLNAYASSRLAGQPAGEARFSRRRASSMNAQPHNRVITDHQTVVPVQRTTLAPNSQDSRPLLAQHEAAGRGAGIPAGDPTRKHSLLISEGQGSLGREATWDDFPNGRWGPSHSPAFGEIDGYGPSLKVGPVTARKLWGRPKSSKDVTDLFRRVVLGQLEAVPWSDDIDPDSAGTGGGALRAETKIIQSNLLDLIEKKGYWTLASQPAVDGAKSEDATFGWGPPGEGFVFQKAFVEFFCPKSEWETHLRPSLISHGEEKVGWMKTDAQGVFESSEQVARKQQEVDRPAPASKRTPGVHGVSAVTWGVFRGKEIISPTIIESESFKAWGEEAYSIWSEWRRCFPRGSDEEKLLEGLRRGFVLVNVVGQNYIGGHTGLGAELWNILLGESGSG